MAVELSDQFGKPYFTKGGQGKLFHDPKPIDAHRYQRGYSPERMSDVHDAAWTGLSGSGEHQAHFKQAVARSTAPLDALRSQVGLVHLSAGHEEGHAVLGTHEVSYSPFQGLGASTLSIFHGAGGEAHSVDKSASHSEVMGATAIHELGHAHHAHSDPDDFLTTQGHREQVADAFATEHYRPDPREVKRGTEAHVEEHSYAAMGIKMKGYRGFAKLDREATARRTARRQARPPERFVDQNTGDHWAEHRSGWHVQNALFSDRRDDGS